MWIFVSAIILVSAADAFENVTEFVTLPSTPSTPHTVVRSTLEADHNWKMVWARAHADDYVISSHPLTRELNSMTISLWVKDTEGHNAHGGYFYYGSLKDHRVAIYRAQSNLYFSLNGAAISCSGCADYSGNLQHIVATWSGTGASNGHAAIWINGNLVAQSTTFRKGHVVPTGDYFYLGRLAGNTAYQFKGELSYVNLYALNISTSAQVERLSKASTDDPAAVISWADFIQGARGEVALVQDYEIYSASFISVECQSTNMTIYLTKTAFPHLIPARGSLLNDSCKIQENRTHVYATTNLDECDTEVTYTTSKAKYTNFLVPDIYFEPFNNSDGTPNGVIDRGSIDKRGTALKFHCTYPLLSHDTIPAYAVKTSNFDVDGEGKREITFTVELYHDSSYTVQYSKHEYPLRLDTGERIYGKAVVHGDNTRMSIWIDKCVATPNPDPSAVTKHDLILDGCPVDTTVQYHNSTVTQEQRFSFESFRFNSIPSAVVYLHCYIDVCRTGNKDSRCSKGLELC